MKICQAQSISSAENSNLIDQFLFVMLSMTN